MKSNEIRYFEKLVIARKYIEVLERDNARLEQEVGMLTSELDGLLSMSKKERTQFKQGKYYEELRREINDLQKNLAKKNKENKEFLNRIIEYELQMKTNDINHDRSGV